MFDIDVDHGVNHRGEVKLLHLRDKLVSPLIIKEEYVGY